MPKRVQRLHHLVQGVPKADLRRAFEHHYPELATGLMATFARLKKLKPTPRSTCRLEITRYFEDGKTRYDVSGVKPASDQGYDLTLSPWPEWLALRVPPELVSEFTAADIVAHCLYEMTFFGFTERKVRSMERSLERMSKSGLSERTRAPVSGV